MSASPGMGRRTILLLAGVVSAKALDFALYVIVARQLGVAGFGLYTFALSFVYLFNVLADLGVTTVLVREVARRPERTRRWIADALLLKAPLAVVTLSVTLAISFATGASSSTLALVAVFTGGVLLNSGAGLFEALLKASVLKGVSIGAHTVVGAGSVVARSLPERVVAVGPRCHPVKHRGGGALEPAA